MFPTHPPAPVARFTSIIDLLCRALGGRVTRPGRPGLPDALLVLIWNRLKRLGNRVARLAARIEAGEKPAPPRPRAARPKRPPATSAPPSLRLPRDRGWLVRLVGYNAAGGASQLAYLLTEPDMAALLAADPRRMGRLLRPLCHMLGIEPPPGIAKPPPISPATPKDPPIDPAPHAAAPPAAAPPARQPTRAPARVPRPFACGPPPLPA